MNKIFKADISYLDSVYEIVRKSSDWMKQQYKFEHWDEWYTKERIEENFIKGDVYLLIDEGIPVATYTIKKHAPSYYSEEDMAKFQDSGADAYYCYTLAVSPEYHGKGFAKQMLAHLEETALQDGIKYIRFDARGDYSELVDFYKKMGYENVGELLDEGDVYYLFEKVF